MNAKRAKSRVRQSPYFGYVRDRSYSSFLFLLDWNLFLPPITHILSAPLVRLQHTICLRYGRSSISTSTSPILLGRFLSFAHTLEIRLPHRTSSILQPFTRCCVLSSASLLASLLRFSYGSFYKSDTLPINYIRSIVCHGQQICPVLRT